MKTAQLSRILGLPLLAGGLVTPALGFPLSHRTIRSIQENPNIKPYIGRTAGNPRPLFLAGGSPSPHSLTPVSGIDDIPLLSTEDVRASCLADVNGDGSDDFVAVLHDTTQTSSNPGSRLMATYVSGPNGFSTLYKIPFTSLRYPNGPNEQIVPADFDRDGDFDILLLDGQSVSWFKNWALHTGRFDTETDIPQTAGQITDVVVMHANGDDWLDLLIADRAQDKIHVYLNNTLGGFNAGTAITEDGPYRLFAFDIDRDGKKDLLSCSGSAGDTAPARLVWRKFHGISFASPSILDTQSGTAWYTGATIADITEDGVDDVVFVRTVQSINQSGATLTNSSVWYRPGNPSVPGAFFTTTHVPEMPVNNWQIYSIGAGDIDSDGDLDFWTARSTHPAFSELAVLENLRPHGDSGPVVADYSGTSPTGVTSLATGDLNGDSWPDLIAAAAGTKAILWYAGGPNGTLDAPVTVSTGGLAPSSISAGDIDFDGNVDLAWAVTATGDIKRSRNTTGTGTAWSTGTIANLPGLNSLTMTNVTRDMDLDLLASSSSGTVQWYNNSNDTFTTDVVLNQPGVARAVPMWLRTGVRQQVVALSPVNSGNPGKVEIRDHFAMYAQPWYIVHSETAGTANSVTAAATAADCDRDGFHDCVWAAGSNEVKWRGVNSAATTTLTIGTAPGTVRNLRCIDWNSDGWSDILCAHSSGVVVWINRAGEPWERLTLYTGGDCTDAIPFCLDADRLMDVAAVDITFGKLKRITHTAPAHVLITDRDPSTTIPVGEPSSTPYVMVVTPKHLGLAGLEDHGPGGWSTDAPAVADRFRFRFLKAIRNPSNTAWVPGPPMTQAELSASVEKIMIVHDSWNGLDSAAKLDSPDDIILGEAGISLTNGYQTVTIGTSATILEHADVYAGAPAEWRRFVALKFKSTVSSVTTGRFYIQHVTDAAQTPTRYATLEGWPARQPLNVTGVSEDTYQIRISTPYEIWRKAWYGTTSNTGTAADSADNDKDGMDNLAEYILGKNPTVADASPALTSEVYNGSLILYADLPPTAREDGIVTLQESTNLDFYSWTTYASSTGGAVWVGAPNSTIFSNGLMRTTFAPPGGSARKFYRLRFSLVP